MTGSLGLACMAALLTIAPTGAQVRLPAGEGMGADTILHVRSVAVDGDVLALTGPDGHTTTIPDGKFLGPRGSSVTVLRGRITEYVPPGVSEGGADPRDPTAEPTLRLSSMRMEAGRVYLVATSGREAPLADGTYVSANGAAVVVEGGTIVGLRTD